MSRELNEETAVIERPRRDEGRGIGPIASILRDWNHFWFEYVSPTPMALVRIVMGLLVLFCNYQLWPDRFAWFSDHGVMTTQDSTEYNLHASGSVAVHWIALLSNAPDWWVNLFFVALSIAAFCMTVGFCTRTSILLVWCGLYSINTRNIITNNTGYDAMIHCATVYLFFSNCGGACSVDRLIRVWRGKERAGAAPLMAIWPQRLLQLQVAIVYICTFCSQATIGAWQQGTAVYFPYMLPDLHKFTIPWIDASHVWAINIMTYGALTIEFALGTLVWDRRFRPYVLFGGILLHAGIEYGINIPVFGEAMVGSYIAFFRQRELRLFATWFAARFHVTPLRVIYDGDCGYCRSVKLLVERFDVFQRITFLNYHSPTELKLAPEATRAEAETAAIAVNANGRKYFGFYAFRQIARRAPVLWILVPLLYAIPWPFKMAVTRIAANRMKLPVAPALRDASAESEPKAAKP